MNSKIVRAPENCSKLPRLTAAMNPFALCSIGERLKSVVELETASYPADEAASPQTLQYRAAVAPELFRVAVSPAGDGVLGFVCGTAATRGTLHLTHESMTSHDPCGNVVCIHSVVVHPDMRRNGLGLNMLKAFVEELRHSGRFDKVLLLSKRHLVSFYELAGFQNAGPSCVQHGDDQWFELRYDLA
jgi:GNAT superfamily N-acetyltransferase